MKTLIICCIFLSSSIFAVAAGSDTRFFELRIYHCYPGKLGKLIERFNDHTTRIFEKHKMENIGYWLPVHNEDNNLYYILAYPSKKARDSSWNAFHTDPEWIDVSGKSEKDGKIVEKVTSIFMNAADIPFAVKSSQKQPERVFELRTYYCPPGKLPDLEKRFTDHTIRIFGQHSMESIGYWTTIEPDGSQPKLIYIIAHSSEEDAKKSWDAFRSDPNWIKVKADSEMNGKIVEKTESVFLKPLPFSKIR